jgi:hypothetical protein
MIANPGWMGGNEMLNILEAKEVGIDRDAIKIGKLVRRGDPIRALKSLWDAGCLSRD